VTTDDDPAHARPTTEIPPPASGRERPASPPDAIAGAPDEPPSTKPRSHGALSRWGTPPDPRSEARRVPAKQQIERAVTRLESAAGKDLEERQLARWREEMGALISKLDERARTTPTEPSAGVAGLDGPSLDDQIEARYLVLLEQAGDRGEPASHCAGADCWEGPLGLCTCRCPGCDHATALLAQATREIAGERATPA